MVEITSEEQNKVKRMKRKRKLHRTAKGQHRGIGF